MPAKSTKSRLKHAKRPTKIHHYLLSSVWPHHRNSYRPHLIRPIGLTLVIGLVLGLQLGTVLKDTNVMSSVLGDKVTRTQDELLTFTNSERLSEGIPALQLDSRLSKAAELKARDILNRQYWGHNAPDGTTPWHWFREVNYRYDFAGENLAKGFTNTDSVIAAWKASSEHNENMMSRNYQDVGFAAISGVLDGESTLVIVAMYGSTVGRNSLPSDTSVLAAAEGDMSIAARLGVALKSMTALQLGSVVLLLIAAFVALAAHAYRKRLPEPIRKGWKRHHGLYKFLGLSLLAIIVVIVYGPGNL